MTTRGRPEEYCSRFCQYVEDSSLRAYHALVIQNASDMAREHDRVRNHTTWAYLQDKKKSWIGEDVTVATDSYSGKHFRMGFLTMPASQERLPAPCSAGFSVRSQSLHSVGGDDHAPKPPPPKPKRDPNTKLSSSSEALSGGPGPPRTPNEPLQLQDVKGRFQPCGEECRKRPPPKPKRDPNTQLSTSFDESHILCPHGDIKTPLPKGKGRTPSHSPASREEEEEEEAVYIEMVGNVLGAPPQGEQSECVYEEMKSSLVEEDIPPPFPNLLTHRPPLLVFPPAPAQCSPNSDESPLTPLDVTRLPVLDHVAVATETPRHASHRRRSRDKERDKERDAAPSGRSSAPPLASHLYQPAGSSHSGQGYPRSRSACPSPVSMRCLTPLPLKRPPPYDSLPRGLRAPDPPDPRAANGPLHSVSSSPPEEASRLLMMQKGPGGRKGSEGEAADSRTAGCRLGRSASTSGVPSARPAPHPALSQMPWMPCGDTTMMQMMEQKRALCGEIKKSLLSKQDSMPILPPRCKRKQPPPYTAPHSTAAFWDTAI